VRLPRRRRPDLACRRPARARPGLCGAYALQPHLPVFSVAARAGILCAVVLLAAVLVVLERLSAVLWPVAVTLGQG